MSGHDLKPASMDAFDTMGGKRASNAAEVGTFCDAVFVMVMTGDEEKSVILGKDGLVSHMKLAAQFY